MLTVSPSMVFNWVHLSRINAGASGNLAVTGTVVEHHIINKIDAIANNLIKFISYLLPQQVDLMLLHCVY